MILVFVTPPLEADSSIIDGIGNKKVQGWAKAFNIGLGALAIVASSLAIIFPLYGVILVAFVLAIGLAAYGVKLIASGIAGQKQAMTPAASRTDTGAAA